MKENIEFSKDWLLQEIIKTDLEEKKSGKEKLVTIKYINLLKMFQKFIQLNERGEL